jgi:hypothetical protein
MGYAEAVQVMLDDGKEAAQFAALVKKYFEDTFHNVNGVWTRGDPGDGGPPYRNVIGIPYGVKGVLYPALVKANINKMRLIDAHNAGGTADSIDEGVVYVYCSIEFPFYRGEQYHMFHKNVVLRRTVPDEYLVDASQAAKARGWDKKTCSETSVHTTNVEVVAEECSAAVSPTTAGLITTTRAPITTTTVRTTTAKPTPCDTYQVRCNAMFKKSLSSDCIIGSCVDCTAALQARGLNCAIKPTNSLGLGGVPPSEGPTKKRIGRSILIAIAVIGALMAAGFAAKSFLLSSVRSGKSMQYKQMNASTYTTDNDEDTATADLDDLDDEALLQA